MHPDLPIFFGSTPLLCLTMTILWIKHRWKACKIFTNILIATHLKQNVIFQTNIKFHDFPGLYEPCSVVHQCPWNMSVSHGHVWRLPCNFTMDHIASSDKCQTFTTQFRIHWYICDQFNNQSFRWIIIALILTSFSGSVRRRFSG